MLSNIDIPEAELARLNRAMLKIQAVKGVPMAKVIRNAARDFVQEAYRATPLAKKRQTDFLYLGKKRPPHGGRGRPRWVRKEPTKSGSRWDPPFSIARGFSKSSWIGMMRQLGMNGKRSDHASAAVYGDVFTSQANDKMFTELVNTLPWIGKLDDRKGIQLRGIRKATERIERELIRLGEQIEDDWSKP